MNWRQQIIFGGYFSAVVGILMLLCNYFFGGAPSKFGWIRASNPKDQMIMWGVFSGVCLALALFLQMKQKVKNKNRIIKGSPLKAGCKGKM